MWPHVWHLAIHWLDDGRHEFISTFAWEAIKTNLGASAWLAFPVWVLIEWRIAIKDEHDHRSLHQIIKDMLHPHQIQDAEQNIADDVVDGLQKST